MTSRLSKFIFLLLLLLCDLSPFLNAQDTVSDFLLTAFEDINLKQFDEQQTFLSPRNYRLPVVDELELRYGNDEFNYEDLSYAARFTLSNPWMIRRNNAYFNATRKHLEAEKKVQFKENMFIRYETAITYLFEKELSEILEKQLKIAEKVSSIFENNQESDLFDAQDYVDNKLEQVDLISEMDEALVEAGSAREQILSILNIDNFDWSEFNPVTVAQIDSISSQIATGVFSSAELELIAQEVEVARRDLLLEKTDFNFGYFQLEYFPFTNRDSEMGISAGITIPLFKTNRPQIAKAKLDELQIQNEFDAEQYQDSLNRVIQYQHLKTLITHYERVEAQINRLDLSSVLISLSKIESYDPIPILNLEEGILKLDELLLKSKQRVMEQYLEFLFTYDSLITPPLINYLSGNFELIE